MLTIYSNAKNVHFRTFTVRVRTSNIITNNYRTKDFQKIICVLKYFYSTFVE